MENNQGGGSKRLYVAIIILLLFINCIALYLLWSENKAKNDLGGQKTTLENEFKSLNDTLDSKKQQMEDFRGKNSELDSIITAQEGEIDKQKATINALRAKGNLSASELAKAKEMLSQDESHIADLQKKVDELTKQNQQLNSQNQELNTNLTNEKQNSAQLSAQNKGLSKKVELGSLLQLRNITIDGIVKKKNGKESIEKKAKKIESLRIAFETGDNKVLEPGQVSLFVRIINPKGETIAVADQGSGTITDATSNQTVQFSKKADFDWTQTNKKIVVYWSQNVKDAGTYKIEVYQSGYMVGSGSIILK
jgi:hypothetical protein